MESLSHLIEQYGMAVVFVNVLVEQLGTPLPAYPTLLITGAMLERGEYSALQLLATAVIAALIADYAWYLAGRRYGRKVMTALCRISLSPDSCVRQTESVYSRWGPSSLLVAKFVPGFASIASALAGTTNTRPAAFIVFDGLGAALWAGSAILLGSTFSTAIEDLLAMLAQLGKWGALLMALALVLFITSKWWQRQRFLQSLRMARISVDELRQLQQRGAAPVIIDVRAADAPQTGRIPGAFAIARDRIAAVTLDISPDQEVILYCACPNEASAAVVAKQLMRKGFKRVRPLHGGIAAWIAAGHMVEP